MSAEKIPSIFKERVVRVTALTTAVIAASSASLLIVREIHQLREIEKKRVLIQQAAKDIDTGEAISVAKRIATSLFLNCSKARCL